MFYIQQNFPTVLCSVKEVAKLEARVEEMVDTLADQSRGYSDNFEWSGHYSGIYGDAVREEYGNGFYSMEDAITDMMNGWKQFPATWPWQKEHSDGTE